MQSQVEIIIEHMKTKGAITALEAMRRYGIGRLAARIADIKKRGYAVRTETVTTVNRRGKKMRYARYTIWPEKDDE
jgi:hypothetical protein